MSPLVQALLSKRGLTEPDAVEAFLRPDYERHTHSPSLLLGMERALVRIFAAIATDERIAVYADFDCDGIPGAAVLSDFFQKIRHGNFEVYLPHRDREGYGLHKEAIQELSSRGVSLIITVDVGTNALEAVEYAKGLGIDVIVTDHHEITGDAMPVGRQVPDCVAVLNPKLGEYPFRELCGAAVAWKLVQALIAEGKRRGLKQFTGIAEGWEKWLLDMVAIATVADMVPLVGENRVLTHFGLRVLRKSSRPGIAALCNRLRLRREELTEDDIAFSIAPRINAASRMGEPDLAFALLTTNDPHEAEKLVAHLESLNSRRKGVVASVVRQARKSVQARYDSDARVVVLGDPEWKPAILGLAANSIMAERGGVVCLWGRDASGRLKGSCRSDGSVSVVELFSNAKESLQEFGGHAKSGGFSVSHEHVHTLPETLARAAEALEQSKTTRVGKDHDALTSLSELSFALFGEVSQLAPFGIGNPKPVFQVCDVVVANMRRFGRDEAHMEFQLECRRSGARARAFDFFRTPESFTHAPRQGGEARILATLERDSFRGGLALRVVDMLEVS